VASNTTLSARLLICVNFKGEGPLNFGSMFTVRILRPDATEANPHELGRIVVKLPLPPGTMATLYKANERFKSVYFTKYPVSS